MSPLLRERTAPINDLIEVGKTLTPIARVLFQHEPVVRLPFDELERTATRAGRVALLRRGCAPVIDVL